MKRPTTAWSTLPAKTRSRRTGPRGFALDVAISPFPRTVRLPGHLVRPALLLAVCGLLCLAGPAGKATADDGSSAVYSTGERGHQLKWLPYRPTVVKVDPNVRPTAHTEEALPPAVSEEPRVAARPTPARNSDSPFNDPFGDREATVSGGQFRPDADLLAQQGSLLEPPTSRPGFGESLPPLTVEPLPPRGPIQIDDPTAPRGLSPLPIEPLDQTVPEVPREPAVEPLEPAIERLEPTIEGPPAEDPGLIESELRGQPDRELPPVLKADEDPVRHEADITLKCISPKDFRPVTEITTDITPRGSLPNECPLTDEVFDLQQARPWSPITFTWKASGLCHKPLYFEQAQLERYGHSWGPYVQPFISGAHFFLTVPILPYKMGLNPPGECMYSLGYYRPGNCAPYMLDPIPLSVRAGLAQAGVMTGVGYVFP